MPPASAMGDAMPRFARRVLVLLVVGILVPAAALTFLRLRDIDPRGRASWSATPLVLDQKPRELTVFVPGCDVRSLVLHPGADVTGSVARGPLDVAPADHVSEPARRLGVEFARRSWGPRAQVWTTSAGGATVRVLGSSPIPVPLESPAPAWREALTLQLRVQDHTGQAAAGVAPLALDTARPVTLDLFDDDWLGHFACAFDGADRTRAWTVIGATFVLMVGMALLGAAWLARAISPTAVPRLPFRAATWLPVLLAGATTIVYALVVPPFEAPDELAHFDFARYVATTGTLPGAVPAADDEWRASSYEWVQQPLYYIGAAALLKVTGLDAPGPSLVMNPRSRLQPGGTEPTIFEHAAPPVPATAHEGLRLLRLMSLFMAVGTALVIARLVTLVTDDGLIAATVAGGLGLVPQWCAVMGAVSTDPPATFLAAIATLAIARVGLGRAHTGCLLLTGLSIGAAYAVKSTAVFLVPMALLACAIAATDTGSPAAAATRRSELWRFVRRVGRYGLLVVTGILLASAWIHVRAWIVFGDPLAFAFKKAVLEAGGFVPTRGPMPWHPEFWGQMRVMVFEPFWARFGSLGAGPFPGSSVWLVYGAASLLLLASATVGVCGTWLAGLRQVRAGNARGRQARRVVPVSLCVVGVCAGLAAWIGVNLAPRADIVVHWTPRHILPLTAPAAVLIAGGLSYLSAASSRTRRLAALVVGLTLPALALAWLGVLRATVLMFHFGY